MTTFLYGVKRNKRFVGGVLREVAALMNASLNKHGEVDRKEVAAAFVAKHPRKAGGWGDSAAREVGFMIS
jgi:ABC-type proline/glycine betaine transport system substrate-binding protein